LCLKNQENFPPRELQVQIASLVSNKTLKKKQYKFYTNACRKLQRIQGYFPTHSERQHYPNTNTKDIKEKKTTGQYPT